MRTKRYGVGTSRRGRILIGQRGRIFNAFWHPETIVRQQIRFALPIIAALAVVACGGGSSSPTTPSTNSSTNSSGSASGSGSGNGSTLTAVIDGTAWNQPNVTVVYHQTNNPYLEIDSADASGNLFSIAFSKFLENGADLTTGTYAVGPTDTTASFVTVGGTPLWSAIPGVNGNALQGSGSVVLTAFSKASKTASGTFSFVLKTANGSSTKTVTSGTFSVMWT